MSLAVHLEHALETRDADALQDVATVSPDDERDALFTLSTIYDLWTAPLPQMRGREEFQNHPAVAAVKWQLEGELIERLDARSDLLAATSCDPVAAMRTIAASDLVPDIYAWLASSASWPELVRFLELEGGPDGGFDDLVAVAQVGIHDGPKLALAANYWDELGRGELSRVHTRLHCDLVAAIEMSRIPARDRPTAALERETFGGLLATNRRLQPEMIGALGLIEMQAGPRCRAVLRAMTRLGAPRRARAFYEEHAEADPLHGRAWLDEVVAPLAQMEPGWAPRMVKGAQWREAVNRRFLEWMEEEFATTPATMAS